MYFDANSFQPSSSSAVMPFASAQADRRICFKRQNAQARRLKRVCLKGKCGHIDYLKTMVVPLRIPSQLYREVQSQARRRDKKVSEMLKETIRFGLSALPALPETSVVVLDTWEKLGPAPDIDYDKL